MTSSIPVSAALLRTRLVANACHDEELVKGYETGAAHTRKASPRPSGAIGRFYSRFIPKGPRARPMSPDREASRRRKRVVGGPSELPEKIRENYSHGEQAVLAVVVREVMKHGCCDLCIDQIAAFAGVGRTTVQNALRKAKDDENAHVTVEERPRPGRKNLSNVIRIVSKEWVDWLKRRIGFKKLKTTKIPDRKISLSECAAQLLRADEAGEAATKRPCTSMGEARPERSNRWRLDHGRQLATGSASYG